MSAPEVSVVMPVYNGESYLPAAVESLLGQTQRDFELLIVDDGSSDRTPELAEGYARSDGRVRLLRQGRQGVSAARNLGLRQARGRYLAWLDADDIAHPTRLEVQTTFLDAHPDVVILGSAYRQIDERGAPAAVHRMPQTDTRIRWHALFHCPFAQPAVMQRADTLRERGLEYGATNASEDYELFSRLLEFGCGHNLAEALIDYRVFSEQASQTNASNTWLAACDISKRNIQRLGVSLSREQIAALRGWFYRFPRRFAPPDVAAAEALLAVVEAFSRTPGLDAAELRRIQGQVVLRVLRAAPAAGAGIAPLLRGIGWGGLSAGLHYAIERARNGGG